MAASLLPCWQHQAGSSALFQCYRVYRGPAHGAQLMLRLSWLLAGRRGTAPCGPARWPPGTRDGRTTAAFSRCTAAACPRCRRTRRTAWPPPQAGRHRCCWQHRRCSRLSLAPLPPRPAWQHRRCSRLSLARGSLRPAWLCHCWCCRCCRRGREAPWLPLRQPWRPPRRPALRPSHAACSAGGHSSAAPCTAPGCEGSCAGRA